MASKDFFLSECIGSYCYHLKRTPDPECEPGSLSDQPCTVVFTGRYVHLLLILLAIGVVGSVAVGDRGRLEV